MSTTPRPWSAHEDELLRNAVAQHGDGPGVWKLIANVVPGRSNKACRKRWLHSLSPTVRKTPWTPAEDALLLKLYATHTPPRWSLIAKHIPGRTDDACSKRYREALDPLLKKDGWTPEEDAKLVELTAQLGSKWTQVGQAMGRSGLGCRNRLRLLERKQRPRNPPRPVVAIAGLLSPNFPAQDGNPGLPSPLTHDPSSNINHHPHYDGFPTSLASSSSSVHYSPLDSVVPVTVASSSCLIHSPHSSLTGVFASAPFVHTRNTPPNSSVFVSVTPDLASPPQSPPAAVPLVSPHSSSPSPQQFSTVPVTLDAASLNTCPTLVPPSPPVHPGADPGIAIQAPNEAPSSISPRKRPRLRSSPSTDWPISERTHLSSYLPVDTGHSVLPYACGYPTCWLGSVDHSRSRFATACELTEHRRVGHSATDSLGDGGKPYRCALQGCGKGWKNINGIQYHLQISKAHFKTALCQSRAPPSDAFTEAHVFESMTENNTETHTQKRKVFRCPHQGCTNSYKQRNGLQYHLAHGHPAHVAQLNVIPPVLMRRLNVQGGSELHQTGTAP